MNVDVSDTPNSLSKTSHTARSSVSGSKTVGPATWILRFWLLPGLELNKGASPQRSLVLENRDVLGIWTTMMISEATCDLILHDN